MVAQIDEPAVERALESRHNGHVKWPSALQRFARTNQVWAALGTARADSEDAQYPSGEKHAFLVMAKSNERQVELRVASFLATNGWKDVVIERIKLLNHPFHSDDAVMLDCYNATTRKGAGAIIYSGPISDEHSTQS